MEGCPVGVLHNAAEELNSGLPRDYREQFEPETFSL